MNFGNTLARSGAPMTFEDWLFADQVHYPQREAFRAAGAVERREREARALRLLQEERARGTWADRRGDELRAAAVGCVADPARVDGVALLKDLSVADPELAPLFDAVTIRAVVDGLQYHGDYSPQRAAAVCKLLRLFVRIARGRSSKALLGHVLECLGTWVGIYGSDVEHMHVLREFFSVRKLCFRNVTEMKQLAILTTQFSGMDAAAEFWSAAFSVVAKGEDRVAVEVELRDLTLDYCTALAKTSGKPHTSQVGYALSPDEYFVIYSEATSEKENLAVCRDFARMCGESGRPALKLKNFRLFPAGCPENLDWACKPIDTERDACLKTQYSEDARVQAHYDEIARIDRMVPSLSRQPSALARVCRASAIHARKIEYLKMGRKIDQAEIEAEVDAEAVLA